MKITINITEEQEKAVEKMVEGKVAIAQEKIESFLKQELGADYSFGKCLPCYLCNGHSSWPHDARDILEEDWQSQPEWYEGLRSFLRDLLEVVNSTVKEDVGIISFLSLEGLAYSVVKDDNDLSAAGLVSSIRHGAKVDLLTKTATTALTAEY